MRSALSLPQVRRTRSDFCRTHRCCVGRERSVMSDRYMDSTRTRFQNAWRDEVEFLEAEHKRTLIKRHHAQRISNQSAKCSDGNRSQDKKRKKGYAKEKRTAGLALSGGGIRAASFSIGVMQSLNKKKKGEDRSLLDEVDYLSTVSGGGYAGAALTWFRNIASQNGKTGRSTELNKKTLARFSRFPASDYSQNGKGGKLILDFIRYRKNHLTPTVMLNFTSLLAVVLRTVLISWPIFLAGIIGVLFLIYGASHAVGHWLTDEEKEPFDVILNSTHPPIYDNIELMVIDWLTPDATVAAKPDIDIKAEGLKSSSSFEIWFHEKGTRSPELKCQKTRIEKDTATCAVNKIDLIHNALKGEPRILLARFFMSGVFMLGIVSIALSFLFLTLSRTGRHWGQHYVYRRNSQKVLGASISLMVVFFALWAIAYISGAGLTSRMGPLIWGVLTGNIVGAFSFKSLLEGAAKNVQLRSKLIIIAISIVLLLANILLAMDLFKYLIDEWKIPIARKGIADYMPFVFFVLFIAAGLRANLNYVSLNRMYRDRLMEAFLPDPKSVLGEVYAERAQFADGGFLKDMAQRPYPLINTNIVLSSSIKSKERGRSGDSFILSPFYCGSRATGYRSTTTFATARADGEGGMTLATAMAISGAAISPRVGPGGWDTPINNPIISSMMSYYNLRLGCWVSNPNKVKQGHVPTFYQEGLYGLLNIGFDEKAEMVELTDGGHFENMGLYELLQRRTDLIILADASADGDFNFKDLGIAIERIRVDQGVSIRFDCDGWDLAHLMPDSAKNPSHYSKRYKLAERGFAIANIYYPKAENHLGEPVAKKTGRLIYLKPVMTRGLPGDLYGYKGAYDVFPVQPISDQMFDESQFEAYRELGYQVTEAMKEAEPNYHPTLQSEIGAFLNKSDST